MNYPVQFICRLCVDLRIHDTQQLHANKFRWKQFSLSFSLSTQPSDNSTVKKKKQMKFESQIKNVKSVELEFEQTRRGL